MRRAWLWWAQGLGLGLLPVAPGTWGSLLALPLWLALGGARMAPGTRAIALLALGLTAWRACEEGERAWGHDPSRVVADEVAGQFLALTLGPAALLGAWPGWLAAFLLFRLFDIWKPGWVDRAQRLPGGLGVLADDLLAGLLAAGCLWLWAWWAR
jgi:phosphatidylglycerophosphatase A